MRAGNDVSMGGAEWGLLVALALLWAGSFFFYKLLVAVLAPFTIVFARVAIAAAVLNLVVVLRGARLPVGAGLWARFAVLGLLNNAVPFSLIVFGETRLSSGVASILIATTPMFTILAARVVSRDETLGAGKLAGLALGICGVGALVGPAALEGLGRGDAWAHWAVLAAALSYGCAGVFGRRFRALPPLTVACAQLSSSAVLMLPIMILADRPWTLPMPGAGSWAALLGLSLFSTALAYILFFRILARAGATAVSLVTLLVPVGAVLLGTAFLEERVGASGWAGMALVGLGLLVLDGRAFRAIAGRTG